MISKHISEITVVKGYFRKNTRFTTHALPPSHWPFYGTTHAYNKFMSKGEHSIVH